jgi:hypothetical protein
MLLVPRRASKEVTDVNHNSMAAGVRVSRSITGVIDWPLAAFPELPVHDVLHMLCSQDTRPSRELRAGSRAASEWWLLDEDKRKLLVTAGGQLRTTLISPRSLSSIG